MGKSTEPSPEQRAEWEEAKRLLQERIDWRLAQRRELREREERRRRRLRQVSFGLLGRG
jgi:ferric-dicitrate binding protein FerR (iron transport regulator)